MTTPTPTPSTPLAEALVALRAVLADERQALANLDVAALSGLTERKEAILAALTPHAPLAPTAAEARMIVAAKVELAANAALLAATTEGVGALLGHGPDERYDRHARCYAATQPLRTMVL